MRKRLFLRLSLSPTFTPSFSSPRVISRSLSFLLPLFLCRFRAHLLTISCRALLTQRDQLARDRRVPFPFVSHLRGPTRRRIAWAIAYEAPRQREHGVYRRRRRRRTAPRLSSRILSCATSPLSARRRLITPFSFFLSLSFCLSPFCSRFCRCVPILLGLWSRGVRRPRTTATGVAARNSVLNFDVPSARAPSLFLLSLSLSLFLSLAPSATCGRSCLWNVDVNGGPLPRRWLLLR